MCDQGGGKCLEAELTRRGFASDKRLPEVLVELDPECGNDSHRTKEDFRIRD